MANTNRKRRRHRAGDDRHVEAQVGQMGSRTATTSSAVDDGLRSPPWLPSAPSRPAGRRLLAGRIWSHPRRPDGLADGPEPEDAGVDEGPRSVPRHHHPLPGRHFHGYKRSKLPPVKPEPGLGFVVGCGSMVRRHGIERGGVGGARVVVGGARSRRNRPESTGDGGGRKGDLESESKSKKGRSTTGWVGDLRVEWGLVMAQNFALPRLEPKFPA